MVSKCTCTKVREDKAGVWQGKAQLTAKFLDQGSIKKKKNNNNNIFIKNAQSILLVKKFHYQIIHFLRI
jgi:hypothetical protein